MISRNRGESRVVAPFGRRHTLRATYCLSFYTSQYIRWVNNAPKNLEPYHFAPKR